MERLTYWNKDLECWSYHGPSGEAAIRLAAYEDAMSLERVQELATAEKNGRLVVLQEGVTVRRLQEEYRKAKHMADERLPSPDYTTGRIAGFGEGVIHILDKILTREEAEAALKKMEEKEMARNALPIL